MKKIVLITTGQPATNPRLVKEADSLAAAGYEVTVLYSYYIRWADDFEREFLPSVSWRAQRAGGSPGAGKWLYLFTRLRFRLARFLNRYISAGVWAGRAQARAYDELLKAAIRQKADLYIGHNLGALPVAVRAARYHRAKAGFDFEDYHRGEFTAGEPAVRRIAWLENRYVPLLAYYSSSSPLIAEALQADHPGFQGKRITLLNCFPLHQQPAFQQKDPNDPTLRLFWFSQTIGANRGLEAVIEALKKLNDPSIRLTLVGRCTKEMQAQFQQLAGAIAPSIHFQGLLPPAALPAFASQFDIGLAVETGFSINNNLALSNKLFTYLLAGNAILVSDTEMQKSFTEAHQVGQLFGKNNQEDLDRAIRRHFSHEYLNRQKRYNYELAKEFFNWEKESVKLIATIHSVLGLQETIEKEDPAACKMDMDFRPMVSSLSENITAPE